MEAEVNAHMGVEDGALWNKEGLFILDEELRHRAGGDRDRESCLDFLKAHVEADSIGLGTQLLKTPSSGTGEAQ